MSTVIISNQCVRFHFFNILRTYSARFSLLYWLFSSLKTKSISVYFYLMSIKYAVMSRNVRWFELLYLLNAMKTLICILSSVSTSFQTFTAQHLRSYTILLQSEILILTWYIQMSFQNFTCSTAQKNILSAIMNWRICWSKTLKVKLNNLIMIFWAVCQTVSIILEHYNWKL